MKQTKLAVLTILFSLSVIFAYPQVKKEINVKAGQKLEVNLKTGAGIEIEGWDKNIVEVDVDITGRDADDVIVDISETSNGVLVTTEFETRTHNNSTKGKVKVKVPYKFDLKLKTTGGGISIENVEGNLTGTTMGGSLSLKNLKGDLELKTMGGSIELIDSEVDGEVSTMGGSVLVENVIGDVDASTMGGTVTQKNVKSSKGSTGKEVKMKSMGGSINVDEAINGANVSTMGGSVRVNKAAEYVKASTMGGSVLIKEIAGWVDASTMGGDVEVTVVGTEGKRDVKLSSMSGDITLYVPADLSMDIEIEIIYDDGDEDDVDVISDFNLSEKVEDAGSKWKSHDNKLVATGVTGSGSNKIKITTVHGKVYLKKS
ncbi:MAG: hypothetical protein QY331_15770 [Melioribacteraceae bacterium]|nr:MAG: hypothetical protein QY331_15770 [Melioribacteraceae bacterium]